ncbi:hypothetical protein V9T40_004926 [Parthenolecanium corni]|uniref:RRM domain-containing protein n=1 Tax=Parthenolecanium corni TaxID=536013 RepID=A0AAN9TCW0_9HEMI
MVKNDSEREPEYLRKLFIGGLDFRTTDETLKAFYEKWGDLVDVVVMKDPNTKRSRGFGFVTYSSSNMVDDAQANRPHVIDGRTVEPKRAIPRNEIHSPETNATVKKLFIAGIKDDVTEDQLKEYFMEFGTVTNVTIVADKATGKKKGFGFVEFDDYDPVDKACLHASHTLNGKRVDVKKAVGRSDLPKGGRGGGGGGRDNWGGGGGRGGGGGSWGSGGGGGGGYSTGPWSGGGNDNWGGNDRWGGGSGGGSFGGGGGGGYNDDFGGGNFGGGPPSRGGGGGGPMRSAGGGGGGPRSAPYSGGRGGGFGGRGRGGRGGGGGGGGGGGAGGGGGGNFGRF